MEIFDQKDNEYNSAPKYFFVNFQNQNCSVVYLFQDKIQRKVKAGPASRKCRNDESSESSNEQDERNENSKGVDSSGKDTDVSNDNDDEEPRGNKLKVRHFN